MTLYKRMNLKIMNTDVSKRLYNYMKQRFNIAEEETPELSVCQNHPRRCKQSNLNGICSSPFVPLGVGTSPFGRICINKKAPRNN